MKFPISTVLFIVFLVLMLTNAIDWSWWWVTAPLWGTVAVLVAILGVSSLIVYIADKATK